MDTRLDKPPRGKFKTVAYDVRNAYFYQREKNGGQLSIRRFAKMVGKSYTAVNNWLDGKSRIRSDSADKVKALSPRDQRPRGGSGAHEAPLDPVNGQPYDGSVGGEARGAVMPSAEGLFIAALLDRIEDDEVRGKAMDAAREAIQRFLSAGAGKKAGPSPGKS